jgi:4-hydroxybenzoate polyprenyltransferase
MTLRAIIFSNLFIAAAASLFTRETYHLLGVEPVWSPLLLVVFFATLFVYNLDRLALASGEDRIQESPRHRWIHRHESALRVSAGVSLLATCVAAAWLPLSVLVALLPLGALALAYSIPVIPAGDRWRRLKDIPGLKVILIAVVWAGATGLLPAIETLENPWGGEVAWMVGARVLFIAGITLPFDIRDMERDARSGIATIPIWLGVEWTRRLALLCIAGFGLLSMHQPALVASAVVTALVVLRADEGRGELYYVAGLDGMMLLQWALVAGWP